jgi:hypothetical protein
MKGIAYLASAAVLLAACGAHTSSGAPGGANARPGAPAPLRTPLSVVGLPEWPDHCHLLTQAEVEQATGMVLEAIENGPVFCSYKSGPQYIPHDGVASAVPDDRSVYEGNKESYKN